MELLVLLARWQSSVEYNKTAKPSPTTYTTVTTWCLHYRQLKLSAFTFDLKVCNTEWMQTEMTYCGILFYFILLQTVGSILWVQDTSPYIRNHEELQEISKTLGHIFNYKSKPMQIANVQCMWNSYCIIWYQESWRLVLFHRILIRGQPYNTFMAL